MCTGLTGNSAVGTAEFTFAVEQPFLNFTIAGGKRAGLTCVNLLVEGKQVATATGQGDLLFRPVSWNLTDLLRKQVTLQIVDEAGGQYGFICVGNVLASASPVATSLKPIAGAGKLPDFNEQIKDIPADFNAAAKSFVAKKRAELGMVGVTAAVVWDGRLVAAIADGKRNVDRDEKLEITDPMHVASNTKGMTALLFARLVEQHRLRFDQSVESAVPYSVDPAFAKIPLISLLWHQSGIDDTTAPAFLDPRVLPNGNMALNGTPADFSQERQTYASLSLHHPPAYPPGSKFVYCNGNFIAIGAIEEIASQGTPWEELMVREVFTPLKMRTAGFGPMGRNLNDEVSAQHVKHDGRWAAVYEDNPLYTGPGGTVHCSVIDFANYAYAQTAGDAGRGDYLLPETWKILHTPPPNSQYACGVFVSPPDADGVRDMSHGGTNVRSCSEWCVNYHGRLILIVFTNCAHGEGTRIILDGLREITEKWFGFHA